MRSTQSASKLNLGNWLEPLSVAAIVNLLCLLLAASAADDGRLARSLTFWSLLLCVGIGVVVIVRRFPKKLERIVIALSPLLAAGATIASRLITR